MASCLFVVYMTVTFFCLHSNANHGWDDDYTADFSHRNGDHHFCDLDVISMDDSLDVFMEKCYFKKACLINSTLPDWTNASFWSRDNLLSSFGTYGFDSGKSLGLVLRAGVGEKKHTLSDYVKLVESGYNNHSTREPMYIFDRTIWDSEGGDEFQHNHFDGQSIPFFRLTSSNLDYNGQILAIGNTGTGAAFHAHGENWLFLISGRKRWFLYPPNVEVPGGFWPGFSSRDWHHFIYPHLRATFNYSNLDIASNYNLTGEMKTIDHNSDNNVLQSDALSDDFTWMHDDGRMENFGNSLLKPLECMQESGQLIYLPEFWWHSVVNLGQLVIGGAIQTSHSRTPWMFERDMHDQVRRGLDDEETDWTDLETDAQRMEGIRAYHRLTKYAPMSAIHPFFVGFEYYDMGDHEMAVRYLKEAVRMDPTYIEAYSYLGRIYTDPNSSLQNTSIAERVLRVAYSMNPNNKSIRQQLIIMFRSKEENALLRLVSASKPLPSQTKHC